MPTDALRRLVQATLAATALMLVAPTHSPGASPGDPHPTFATFAQHVGLATGHESATDVAVQPDGKVVVSLLNDAERDPRIVRLLPDGTLDASFGTGGAWHLPTSHDMVVRAVSLQADGRIVYAGEDASLPGIVIGRLTATGQPDITFSSDGRFVSSTAEGSMPQVEDVFVEASGKVTFVGIVRNGARHDDLFLGRLTSVGTDDLEFSGDPYFLFGSPADGDQDGFGGITQMPNGDYVVGNPHFATASQVWRITSTGGSRIAANVAFPTSFNDPVDVMATDATHAVVLLDGANTTGLAYLDVSGTPKMSTHAGNSGSIQPFPSSFDGHELLHQGDGRFYAAGTDSTGGVHRAIARLDPVGTPDQTWAPNGIRHLSGTSTKRFYLDRQSLAFTPDGSLVTAYHAFAGDVRRPIVEQLVARVARVRAEVATPLAKGVVGTPVEYTLRAVNDGPDASGAGTITFSVADGLRVTSWVGPNCTVDARGGTCRFGSVAAGAAATVTLRVKATSPGSHGVTATVDAAMFDDDTSNDSTTQVHPFDAAPVAPTAAPVTPVAAIGPAPKPTKQGAPARLRLTLQRITGYGGRVIRGCGSMRRMCVVTRPRRGRRFAPAYLRAHASIEGRRTLLLVMQVRQGRRWVVKYRHRLPMGSNGGLDIKLPMDWRARSGTWRMRTQTITRRGRKPTVSGWVAFRVR